MNISDRITVTRGFVKQAFNGQDLLNTWPVSDIKPMNSAQTATIGGVGGALAGGLGSLTVDSLLNLKRNKKKTFRERLMTAIAPALIGGGIGAGASGLGSKVMKEKVLDQVNDTNKNDPNIGPMSPSTKDTFRDTLEGLNLKEIGDPALLEQKPDVINAAKSLQNNKK